MSRVVAVIFAVLIFGLISSGESRCPQPTLPANGNAKYYKGFQKIPPAKVTANKLKKGLVVAGPGNGGNHKQEDTVIVMDGSGSVGWCEFKKGKQALTNLIKIGNDGGHDTRFAGVTFASGARTNFNFLSPAAAARQMSTISYPNGATNTQLGLLYARSLLRTGSRRNARKIVLLVTDGQSNVKRHLTVPNAKALKNTGVEIFVVAVGSYISGIDEMVRVASYPPKKYVFRVQKLKNFLTVVNLVVKEVSPGKYKVMQRQANRPC